MSNPTPNPSSTPPSSGSPASPPSAPTPAPATPQTPWWKNPAVIGVAGLISAVAAVLALFRDTIDFKIGSKPDAPTTSLVSTSNRAPATNAHTYGSGPAREAYRGEEPSPTAVFNSIVDNPKHGDERNYVLCRLADRGKTTYADEVAVRDNVEMLVYVWIDNSSIRSDQAIKGARMDLLISGEAHPEPALNVYLTGDNVIKVWDGCKVLSTGVATLSYIPGSATFQPYDGLAVKLEDAVVRGDRLLPGVRGNAPGVIGGDGRPYGYVEFRVKVLVR
ncbi:hypothetical protein AB0I35_12890 [Nocardia sp. NPDC050378]|uniref:hypothetical protein n=1 Tax=Nocardia sp. NPDC050378 TaxID=3155400 RepID=UPI0033CE61B4